MDTKNALLQSRVGKQDEYVLNNILLGASDIAYKPLVIISIKSRDSYEMVRDKLLHAMSHLAQGGGKNKNKQSRAMATIANGNQNLSGGKKSSKTKNSTKPLNVKF